MTIYRSPYEAYPFLADDINDIRCDFEIFTDEIASYTSLLRTKITDENVSNQLLWLCEMIYHLNPTLRTKFSLTPKEVDTFKEIVSDLEKTYSQNTKGFLLPQGCESACLCHIIRTKSKALVRMVYRYMYITQHETSETMLDFCNLLSAYFFFLAIKCNQMNEVDEISFESRNYKI